MYYCEMLIHVVDFTMHKKIACFWFFCTEVLLNNNVQKAKVVGAAAICPL